jgi:hypothetical protein
MTSPVLTAEQIAALSAATISHYDDTAESFAAATRDHDVSQNYAALLDAIEGAAPFTLLDVGCQFAASCSHLKADFCRVMPPPHLQADAATSTRG